MKINAIEKTAFNQKSPSFRAGLDTFVKKGLKKTEIQITSIFGKDSSQYREYQKNLKALSSKCQDWIIQETEFYDYFPFSVKLNLVNKNTQKFIPLSHKISIDKKQELYSLNALNTYLKTIKKIDNMAL